MDAVIDNQQARTLTRNMRVAASPALPTALLEAAHRHIAAGPASLKEFREAALSALATVGLPQAGSEDYTFIRLGEVLPHLSFVPGPDTAARPSALPKTQTLPTLELVRSFLFPESRESYLVVLDGEYSPGLSHPGPDFKVIPFETGLAAAEPEARAALLGLTARETDAAASLAAIFSVQPLWIEVAPKAAPAAPLQILHLATTSLPARRDAYIAFAAGRLSESRVLVRHEEATIGQAPADKGGMSNLHAAALLAEGASVKWLETAPEGPRNDLEAHFHKLSAVLERDARFFAVSSCTGARVARNAFSVDLRGQGAEADVHGATVLGGTRQAHQFLQVRHFAPHCSSRQHFKTVAADRGRASVDGTILVAEGAQQTNAQQLINNLMLSDEARADSKPRLLIHADDVKCAHGATSGKLDGTQQFYLESRGLPAAQARTLLTLAFIAEIVERTEGVAGNREGGKSGFRALLDATLIDTLKRLLSGAAAGKD